MPQGVAVVSELAFLIMRVAGFREFRAGLPRASRIRIHRLRGPCGSARHPQGTADQHVQSSHFTSIAPCARTLEGRSPGGMAMTGTVTPRARFLLRATARTLLEVPMQTIERMVSTNPTRSPLNAGLVDCITACAECAQACVGCADACLAEEQPKELRRCIRLDQD